MKKYVSCSEDGFAIHIIEHSHHDRKLIGNLSDRLSHQLLRSVRGPSSCCSQAEHCKRGTDQTEKPRRPDHHKKFFIVFLD